MQLLFYMQYYTLWNSKNAGCLTATYYYGTWCKFVCFVCVYRKQHMIHVNGLPTIPFILDKQSINPLISSFVFLPFFAGTLSYNFTTYYWWHLELAKMVTIFLLPKRFFFLQLLVYIYFLQWYPNWDLNECPVSQHNSIGGSPRWVFYT